MEKAYIKPSLIRLERQDATEGLYKLEGKRNEYVRAAAEEWARLNHVPTSEFWTRSLPQQLFDLLESFDSAASKVAAEAYLEHLLAR